MVASPAVSHLVELDSESCKGLDRTAEGTCKDGAADAAQQDRIQPDRIVEEA